MHGPDGGARAPLIPSTRPPSAVRRFFCTFPQSLISQPLISHTLGLKFGVVPNIRAASISESAAHVFVEIEGESAAVDSSVAFLVDEGVDVREIAEGEDVPKF